MYSTSNSSKNKSHRNVCRIDLNDGSDKSRYANNSTVNQRPSTSSPMNQNAPLKNYSSFQNLISQLQPSTSKSSKNYSQNKQLLMCKKNEIIKTALKNSLNIKKPSSSAKTDSRESLPVKPYAKFEKENELPPDARIKSREKMDQFYSNMKYGRAQSTVKQHHGVDRNEGIASYVSPKNRSFIQKAVVPNGQVNLSRLSNAHEPRTTNVTMIKYASDPHEPSSSSRKDRGKSFDYKQDMSNAAKFHMQNRILLDLDESMNMGPIENMNMKGASTTAHAKYSQSKDEIRNVMTPGNYHSSKQRSGSNTRPPKIDFPCKVVREQEKPFQNPKESSPDKDIFEFENISPIKTNHNRGSSAHNLSSNIREGLERAQRNLANQPYPTLVKQINLNSNTPTSGGGKPPLYNFAQQDDVSTPLTTQENEKRFIQDYVKQKSLNIQTVKEQKKIEFPGYLQNLTYDRSKPNKNIAFNTADHRRSETPNERSYKAPLQPATINFIESLKRNRLSERLPEDHSREYGLNKPAMVTDTNRFTVGDGGRESYGGRYTYDDIAAAAAQKRAEMSSRSTAKTPKNGSMVENFVKQLLESSANMGNAKGKPEISSKKINEIPSNENILPSSVKGTFVHPDKYFIDVADILPKKDNKTPQHNIQTPPMLFSNKNQAPPEEKDSAQRKPSVTNNNDINILGIDPAEKEFKMKKFKEDYIIGKQIGQGAYATVRIGVHKPTNTKVAIKIYEKVKIMDPMRSRSVKREIKLMQRIDHQSIIKIYDVVETNNHMNIIMEYIGGTSLHSFLKAQPNRRLKDEHAFNIFKQVVNGLYYCHGRCIAHRDIKLENMLLDSYGNLKIIDFGFSTCIPNDKKVRMFCGTPSYMAPEIVTKAEYCGPPADIWALDVLLFALLCGTFPFKGLDDKDLYAKIAKGEFVIPDFVSENAQSLLRKMMTVDPEKRPTAKEIMSDPWYVMYAFMDRKTDRRVSSRSSSSLDRTRLEKPDSKPNFPSNLNLVQPVGEQAFTQLTNFIKSPQNQFQRDEYAKVDIRNIRRKDDDHPRDQVRHLSLNNSRYTGKQNGYGDSKTMIYKDIKNMNDNDTLVYEDNGDENKMSFKKTLTENEVWNIPANLSSEKSFQPAFGRNSQMQMSAYQNQNQNRSLKRNEEPTGQFDTDIITNLTKMGYKDEEINAGLKEKSGAVYYIYNRMVNEKKALHNSNFADSITSDQNNNNNSFNLSSNMALKRKSVNMAVSKPQGPVLQEKENIYNAVQAKAGSSKEYMGNQEPFSAKDNLCEMGASEM